MKNMQTHKRKTANFMVIGFAAVVLFISATTSFGFFYTYFDKLIPPTVLNAAAGALISGVIGVALFDVACAIWLNTFLNHAETAEQRAVALSMTVATFVGSAAASVAYLGLTATGDLALDAATRGTIAMFALVTVIIGVVSNFGAMLTYQRFSQENKESVHEADLRDAVQAARNDEKQHLVDLVAQGVREEMNKMAPEIARVQASQIAQEVYREEMAKYANLDGKVTAQQPAEQPARRLASRNGKRVEVRPAQPARSFRDVEPAQPAANGHGHNGAWGGGG